MCERMGNLLKRITEAAPLSTQIGTPKADKFVIENGHQRRLEQGVNFRFFCCWTMNLIYPCKANLTKSAYQNWTRIT